MYLYGLAANIQYHMPLSIYFQIDVLAFLSSLII
jgi:hypothetical protein